MIIFVPKRLLYPSLSFLKGSFILDLTYCSRNRSDIITAPSSAILTRTTGSMKSIGILLSKEDWTRVHIYSSNKWRNPLKIQSPSSLICVYYIFQYIVSKQFSISKYTLLHYLIYSYGFVSVILLIFEGGRTLGRKEAMRIIARLLTVVILQ